MVTISSQTLFTIKYSHDFHSLYPNFSISTFPNKPISKIPNHTHISNFSAIRPKSSSPRGPPSPVQNQDNPPPVKSDTSVSHSFSLFLHRLSEEFKLDGLGIEILSIALPAALALAADPITSLVDTAFVGHIGAVELAAVGVSVSVFNLVSKLFNVPLLNITTSFVAEEQALVAKGVVEYNQMDTDNMAGTQSKISLPSVSTSLALATGLGVAEAVALYFGSGFLMTSMGIPCDSPIRGPAEQFLTLRAFGAPPIVIAQAAQGTFRGFTDTKTPLYAVGAGNLLNAILDPVLIFLLGLGIGGAAIATVISEYLMAIILLWNLNDKVVLVSPKIDGRKVARYLKSGGLLIGRTIAVLVTMTLATSMAAREGPIPMAGHQICVEIWLTVSLLTDALALAGQALLAGGYSRGDYTQARKVVYKVLQIGSITGVSLAAILFLGYEELTGLFSSDSDVLKIALSGILFVSGSQPINALAFVIDGLYYGVSDFGYAAYSMVLAGMISSLFIVVAAPAYGLAGVWAGLFLFMTLRVVAGVWRLGTKGGPWNFLLSEMDEKDDL